MAVSDVELGHMQVGVHTYARQQNLYNVCPSQFAD